LSDLTKTVLETALEVEMEDHLGYAKHAPEGRDKGNSRNGTRSKTVLTEVGEVEIDVPRDREGSFGPQIVKKRQRRLSGVDELVISLAAKGLTTGEIAAHFADVYGAEVSRDTISRITDRVLEEMAGWQSRPLDEIYPVIFIDAIQVKIRDGQVANRPVYTVIGVTVDGARDVIGLWIGGEGAKYWHQVLSEIRNRGVNDVLFLVCDGLRRLVESVADVWPLAIVQTCVLHLVRNTFRYASKRCRQEEGRRGCFNASRVGFLTRPCGLPIRVISFRLTTGSGQARGFGADRFGLGKGEGVGRGRRPSAPRTDSTLARRTSGAAGLATGKLGPYVSRRCLLACYVQSACSTRGSSFAMVSYGS